MAYLIPSQAKPKGPQQTPAEAIYPFEDAVRGKIQCIDIALSQQLNRYDALAAAVSNINDALFGPSPTAVGPAGTEREPLSGGLCHDIMNDLDALENLAERLTYLNAVMEEQVDRQRYRLLNQDKTRGVA